MFDYDALLDGVGSVEESISLELDAIEAIDNLNRFDRFAHRWDAVIPLRKFDRNYLDCIEREYQCGIEVHEAVIPQSSFRLMDDGGMVPLTIHYNRYEDESMSITEILSVLEDFVSGHSGE